MGGRGGSSGLGAIRFDTTALDSKGALIDLTNAPLQYGDNDPNLVGAARQILEDFESKRRTSKIEFSRFIDKDGNIIEDNRGGKNSVSASRTARLTADAMSHNHPRSDSGVLGGTFSDGDIANFAKYNQRTYRAAASEGTYSISKLNNFNTQVASWYRSEVAKNHSTYKQTVGGLTTAYNNRNISYSEYTRAFDKATNTFLVDNHNSLLSGQKQFGYTYTLERR